MYFASLSEVDRVVLTVAVTSV